MNEANTDRIEKLLSLILLEVMKTQSQPARILKLSMAGFTNVEIADLLGIRASSVGAYLFEARKAKPKEPRKPRKPRKPR